MKILIFGTKKFGSAVKNAITFEGVTFFTTQSAEEAKDFFSKSNAIIIEIQGHSPDRIEEELIAEAHQFFSWDGKVGTFHTRNYTDRELKESIKKWFYSVFS